MKIHKLNTKKYCTQNTWKNKQNMYKIGLKLEVSNGTGTRSKKMELERIGRRMDDEGIEEDADS